jgi:hypothetical protein
MNNPLIDLFSHEWEALLEALRRDLRAELAKCENDPVCADLHRINVTRNIRLLETINPKRQTLHKNRSVAPKEVATNCGRTTQCPCIGQEDFFHTDIDDRIHTGSAGGLQRNLRSQ